ncbi:hypothetical protein [Haloprofundus sp. MHR1]|uniref:hypothetical protein n=1 Tax=Haloprofundus sp. MHR1 TaxID=2572921 RepID=UPI0010BEE49A|nr:hypothetical protein [Haloprofundus sp. MHR1]QCJ47981.1 hypothetical protein FCF25_13025 [Haloprofundus sp. MHR1]
MSTTGPFRKSTRQSEGSQHLSRELKLGSPPTTAVEDGISDEQIAWLQRLVDARRSDREPKSHDE